MHSGMPNCIVNKEATWPLLITNPLSFREHLQSTKHHAWHRKATHYSTLLLLSPYCPIPVPSSQLSGSNFLINYTLPFSGLLSKIFKLRQIQRSIKIISPCINSFPIKWHLCCFLYFIAMNNAAMSIFLCVAWSVAYEYKYSFEKYMLNY